MIAIEISVSRFATAPDTRYFNFSGQKLSSWNIQNIRISTDGTTVMSLTAQSLFPKLIKNVSVKYCPKAEGCKSIYFDFAFVDPNLPTVLYFDPTSAFTDGRITVSVTTRMPYQLYTDCFFQIKMYNSVDQSSKIIPVADITYDSLSTFDPYSDMTTQGGNQTIRNAKIKFIVPEAETGDRPIAMMLFLQATNIKTLQMTVYPFPTNFSYVPPPPISVLVFTPTQGSPSVTSLTKFSIQNFPGVLQLSDIKVSFFVPSNGQNVTDSLIRSFSRQNPLLDPLSIQDIDVVAQTPSSPQFKVGYLKIQLYHVKYPGRLAMCKYLFVDSNLPSVEGMYSDAGDTGETVLQVPKRTKTSVSVVIGRANIQPYKLVIGKSEVDISFNSFDPIGNTVVVHFYSPISDCESPCSPVYGLILFSAECVACSDASCCQSANCFCGDACKGSACFTLNYYDENRPSIITQSVSEGPSIGGTAINFKINNFPVVSSLDIRARFLDVGFNGQVYVISTSPAQTEILVVTPGVQLNYTSRITFPSNMIQSISQPSYFVEFEFSFYQPSISLLSVFPTKGSRNGNVVVSVSISNFPYPTRVGIMFGSTEVADDKIEYLQESSLQLTSLRFKTLASSQSGQVVSRIFPKECPVVCGQAVSFDFWQDVEAKLVEPIPKQSILGDSNELFVRIENFPHSSWHITKSLVL